MIILSLKSKRIVLAKVDAIKCIFWLFLPFLIYFFKLTSLNRYGTPSPWNWIWKGKFYFSELTGYFFNLDGLLINNCISYLTLICLFLDIFQVYFRNFGMWNRFIRIVWKNIWLRQTLRSAYINNRWTEKAQRSFNKTWNSPLDNQIVLIFCTN